MTEREKVIKGLERIRDYDPIFRVARDDEFSKYAANAIALLKAQEPVKPIRMNHDENKYKDHYRCPICKEDLSYEQNYCQDCGRAVKWE